MKAQPFSSIAIAMSVWCVPLVVSVWLRGYDDRSAGWMDIPICWAPALMRACFAAEVADGSGHWKGSPSAPLGRRVVGGVVGRERAERARVARRVATVSLGVMVGLLGG